MSNVLALTYCLDSILEGRALHPMGSIIATLLASVLSIRSRRLDETVHPQNSVPCFLGSSSTKPTASNTLKICEFFTTTATANNYEWVEFLKFLHRR